MSELLDVKDLVVEIPTRRGILKPVNGVSFTVQRGEIVGVVGESGAGKSITGAAIIGLLDRPGRIAAGSVMLDNQCISALPETELTAIRGRQVGTVFQDPLTSLNPLMTVGDQLIETAMTHSDLSRSEAREQALKLLVDVGIPGAAHRLDAYPHEFSGGMRQRVVIALALIGNPKLVIADEPTTALDVSVQAQVLALLKKICLERDTGVMLITHDMGVIAENTDRVVVMYAGRVVETGNTRDVLTEPRHPYTRGLVRATPDPGALADRQQRLNQIPGSMPGLLNIPGGCAFHPRCAEKSGQCERDLPPAVAIGNGQVACLLYEDSGSPAVPEDG